ncbi:unnamed protein product [Rangifer tarandus platyrhynchus]|uniref:PPIase cyclophilin-type domain-containing protein n=1 Tax=Rangifer tarandus platyrhynchus TaxID=3082113 RepID=A0ABN8XJF4_RANTA|nr:unnamed protein product [Rangifer tarandus platyrhynchus]
MSQSQLAAGRTTPPGHTQPRRLQDQFAAHRKSGKTAWCQGHYDRKECDGDEASNSAMMTIWLVGSVSSVRFQRLRQVCQWIHRSYVSQVSVQIQTILYFSEVDDFIQWAASEFLFEDVLLKEDFPLAEVARRALSEKIAFLCKNSAKVFCRVVFHVNRTAHAMTAFKFPNEQDAPDTTDGENLQRDPLTGVAGSDELASAAAVEVFFEVDSGRVPCSSSIFTEAARRKEYNGCVVHRVVPRGWIQFGYSDSSTTQSRHGAPQDLTKASLENAVFRHCEETQRYWIYMFKTPKSQWILSDWYNAREHITGRRGTLSLRMKTKPSELV